MHFLYFPRSLVFAVRLLIKELLSTYVIFLLLAAVMVSA